MVCVHVRLQVTVLYVHTHASMRVCCLLRARTLVQHVCHVHVCQCVPHMYVHVCSMYVCTFYVLPVPVLHVVLVRVTCHMNTTTKAPTVLQLYSRLLVLVYMYVYYVCTYIHVHVAGSTYSTVVCVHSITLYCININIPVPYPAPGTLRSGSEGLHHLKPHIHLGKILAKPLTP